MSLDEEMSDGEFLPGPPQSTSPFLKCSEVPAATSGTGQAAGRSGALFLLTGGGQHSGFSHLQANGVGGRNPELGTAEGLTPQAQANTRACAPSHLPPIKEENANAPVLGMAPPVKVDQQESGTKRRGSTGIYEVTLNQRVAELQNEAESYARQLEQMQRELEQYQRAHTDLQLQAQIANANDAAKIHQLQFIIGDKEQQIQQLARALQDQPPPQPQPQPPPPQPLELEQQQDEKQLEQLKKAYKAAMEDPLRFVSPAVWQAYRDVISRMTP